MGRNIIHLKAFPVQFAGLLFCAYPQPGTDDQIAFGDLGFDLGQDQDAALPVMHLFVKHLLGEQDERSSK
ncbi:MAG: hypothetical protein OSB05_16820 [Akkermansiaceae bacterium]|nr:hypothetical protein [Akkermansiaceae bacterium]